MTSRHTLRYALTLRHLWAHHSLVAQDGTVHIVSGDVDVQHGYQMTNAPEMVCGEVIDRGQLTEPEYRDARCEKCRAGAPSVDVYPAPPLCVTVSCPVCDDGGELHFEVDDIHCAQCMTSWPGHGADQPGSMLAPDDPDHPDNANDDEDQAETVVELPEQAPDMIEVELADPPRANPAVFQGYHAEVAAYLVSPGMRVECWHDHMHAWVRVTAVTEGLGGDEIAVHQGDRPEPVQVITVPADLVQLALVCGNAQTYQRGDMVRVMTDAPLTVADEPVNA